jgi:peroxiredoxin
MRLGSSHRRAATRIQNRAHGRATGVSTLAEIEVLRPAGGAAVIGELVDRPTILVIPRYYGCMPCRDYLRQVTERYDEVASAGGAALGVSVGAGFQAAWLAEHYAIPFPLLVDPERKVNGALELPRRLSVVLNPRGWWTYARAIAHGNRQGRVVDPFQIPGLALLDAGAEPAWVHRGTALGDYPPLDEVIARLADLAGRPPTR